MIREHTLKSEGAEVKVTDCICDWCGAASRREGAKGFDTFAIEAGWVSATYEDFDDEGASTGETERQYCCRKCRHEASFEE